MNGRVVLMAWIHAIERDLAAEIFSPSSESLSSPKQKGYSQGIGA